MKPRTVRRNQAPTISAESRIIKPKTYHVVASRQRGAGVLHTGSTYISRRGRPRCLSTALSLVGLRTTRRLLGSSSCSTTYYYTYQDSMLHSSYIRTPTSGHCALLRRDLEIYVEICCSLLLRRVACYTALPAPC